MSGVATACDVENFKKSESTAQDLSNAVNNMTRGGTYEVYEGGKKKKIANAAAVNKSFVDRASEAHPVGIEILDTGKDEQKAWSKVAAYFGPRDKPWARTECCIIVNYALIWQKFLWDAIDKGVWLWDEASGQKVKTQVAYRMNGDVPVPTDTRVQVHLVRLFLQKKIFAEREAETHARERAQRQLLATEWRDPDEQDSEREEVEDIAASRNAEAEQKFGPPDVELLVPTGTAKGYSFKQLSYSQDGIDELNALLNGNVLKAPKYVAAAREALEMARRNPPPPRTARPEMANAIPPAGAAPAGEQAAPANNGSSEAAGRRTRRPRSTSAESGGAAPTEIGAAAQTQTPATPTQQAPAPAPAPATETKQAVPTDVQPQETEEQKKSRIESAMIADRNRLIGEIRSKVSTWPQIVVENQMVGYGGVLGALKGVACVPLVQADVADVQKLATLVEGVDATWRLAVSKLGGIDKARAWIDSQAAALGYKENGYFDPMLRQSIRRTIHANLDAIPMGGGNPIIAA